MALLDYVKWQALANGLDVVVDSVHELLRLVYVVWGLHLVFSALVGGLDIGVLYQLWRWVA